MEVTIMNQKKARTGRVFPLLLILPGILTDCANE